MKKNLKIIVGSIISLVFLYIFFRKANFHEVWEGIKNASLPLILLSIVVGLSQNIFRCFRWRSLLDPMKKGTGFYNLFSTTIIGYMVSWIIPGRLGELVRPILLGQRENISKSSAVATIVIERFMDGLAVVFLFGICLIFNTAMFDTQSDHLLKAAFYGGTIFTLVSVAAFAFLLLLVWKKDAIRAFTERRWEKHKSAIVNKFFQVCHSFIEGASALRDVKILIIAAAYSFVIWIVIGIGLWLSLKAMALPVSLSGTFILLPLLVIGIAIPTPGGVGSYHEAMQLGLIGLFQIPRDFAISTAIVVHAITIVPVIILGFIFLWKDGLTFRAVSHIENMAGGTKN